MATNRIGQRSEQAGGRELVFSVYPYVDHARLVVTLRHHRPIVGRDLVLGSIRLDIGREGLAGLSSALAVRLVAVSILNALDAPAPPERPAGGTGAPGGATGATVPQGTLPGLEPTILAGQGQPGKSRP